MGASGSPVFERMLSSDFKESRASVAIRGVASNDVEIFLRFLYTGCLSGGKCDTCSMCDLLTLADMYQVESMVTLVASELERCISVDNVVETARALHKRKAHTVIEPVYRRVSQRVREN